MERKALTMCYKFIFPLSRKYITLQIHTFFVKKFLHYITDFKNFVNYYFCFKICILSCSISHIAGSESSGSKNDLNSQQLSFPRSKLHLNVEVFSTKS